MTGSSKGKENALRIFRGLSASYESVLDLFTLLQDRRWKAWAARSLALTEGSRVLDIGIGTGVLEERLRRDCSVTGVDLTEEMLRAGQERHPHSANALLLSDGENLPFRDSVFDAAVSCYVVKYCDSRVLAFEVARVLRPGGTFVLYDFVRPRGPLWPLNAVFAYGALPLVGSALKTTGSSAAHTFDILPKIIAGSHWEEVFAGELAEAGFSRVRSALLPGGAAMGFTAVR
jgi:ubiquinone/menaquinone biosynthesis C-methylase UbiE